MSKLISVTFVKAWRGYSKGEVAGFEPKVAQGLVDAGFANGKELTAKGKGSGKSAGAAGKADAEKAAAEKAAAEKAAAEKAAAGKAANNEGKP